MFLNAALLISSELILGSGGAEVPQFDPLDPSAVTRIFDLLASLAPLMKQKVETDSGNCGFTWIVLSSMRFVSSATLCAVRAP